MKPARPLIAAALVAIAIGVVIALSTRHPRSHPAPTETAVATPTPIPGHIVLFFVGNDGFLRREERDVPDLPTSLPERARVVIDELRSGSRTGLLSPFGWDATVTALFVDREGNAYVDLSPPGPDSVAGSRGEIALVYSVVHSIVANCAPIERVQLLFGGHEVSTLAHIDLSRPLMPSPALIGP